MFNLCVNAFQVIIQTYQALILFDVQWMCYHCHCGISGNVCGGFSDKFHTNFSRLIFSFVRPVIGDMLRRTEKLLQPSSTRARDLFLNQIPQILLLMFRIKLAKLRSCLQGGRVTLVLGLLQQQGYPNCLVNALLRIIRLPGTTLLRHA